MSTFAINGSVLSEKPFKPGLPTVKPFIIEGNPNFDGERAALITLIEKFGAAGPEEMGKRVHPLFGELTGAQWDHLMVKHLDHHLRQFKA